MNVLTGLIIGGSLIAMSGLPAAADHPAPVNQPFLQVADNDDFTTHKDAYLQTTRKQMTKWRKKMDNAGEQAEAEGHEASADVREHLKRTWRATEQDWQKLETESAEGWEKTKTAYKRSTAELRVQWHKLHPEDQD
jgi:hypothetical protein